MLLRLQTETPNLPLGADLLLGIGDADKCDTPVLRRVSNASRVRIAATSIPAHEADFISLSRAR